MTSHLEERYQILDELGKGSYGKVYRVKKKHEEEHHGEVYVLKQVDLSGMSERDREDTLNEARVMSKCDHFNIIHYYESFIENSHLNIIMEYASAGDLGQKIKDQKSVRFKEEMLWNYLIQISQGLKFLHDQRILHRDIKPQNIYIDQENNIKIGDMGLGRILGPQSNFAYTGVGTPLYFSPELCEEHPYNHKSDIWAFGCLMYEMAALRPPFIASNQIALARKIVGSQPAELPAEYSKELMFLTMKMLEKDPNRRPDINDILNYSAVRVRIQRAKLRHKELKLEEKYINMKQTLQTEHQQKMKRSEQIYMEREIEYVQREQEMERRESDVERRENALKEREKEFMDWENELKRREFDISEKSKAERHISPRQLGSTSIPIPIELTSHEGTSAAESSQAQSFTPKEVPAAQSHAIEDMLSPRGTTQEELLFKFENFCDVIDRQLQSPQKKKEKRRAQSAPSTPQRNQKSRNRTRSHKAMLTPSPRRPQRHHFDMESKARQHRQWASPTSKSTHIFAPIRSKSPKQMQRHPGDYRGNGTFESRFLSSYDLELDNSMDDTLHFETFFQWSRHVHRTAWDNDMELEMSVNSASMLVIIQASSRNQDQCEIAKILARFKNDGNYTQLSPAPPFPMQSSRHPPNHGTQRFVVVIPMSVTKSRLISHLKIEFDNPTMIKRVVVLRYETKLLELAGALGGTLPSTPIQSKRPVHKAVSVSPRPSGPLREMRKHRVRRQLFKDDDTIPMENNDIAGFLSPPQLSPRSVSQPATPLLKPINQSRNVPQMGKRDWPLSPEMVAKLLHLIKDKRPSHASLSSTPSTKSIPSVIDVEPSEGCEQHGENFSNGHHNSQQHQAESYAKYPHLQDSVSSSDESDAGETLRLLREEMKQTDQANGARMPE